MKNVIRVAIVASSLIGSAAFAQLKVPSFDLLYKYYPSGDAAIIKAKIGGKVNAAWITNTCTVRLSRALNYSGIRVPSNFMMATRPPNPPVAAVTVGGADGRRYLIRVREMHAWMKSIFPNIPARRIFKSIGASYPTGALQGPPKEILGKRGILYVKVDVWSDATGHFGVWNGNDWLHTTTPPNPDHQLEYFGKSSGWEFWESGR